MRESAARKASAGTDHRPPTPPPRTPTSTLRAAAIIKQQVLKPGSDTDNHSLSGVTLASAVSVLLPLRKPGRASQCQVGKSTFIKSGQQGRGEAPPPQKLKGPVTQRSTGAKIEIRGKVKMHSSGTDQTVYKTLKCDPVVGKDHLTVVSY